MARKQQKGFRVKYTKVKFDTARIIKLYKAGKSVNEIALAIGYPPRTGQNRTRLVLAKAGLYSAKSVAKAGRKKQPIRTVVQGTTALARVLTIPAARDTDDRKSFHVKLKEVFRVAKSRFDSLQPKQRSAWMDALVGLLLAESGAQVPRTFEPVAVPEQYVASRVAQA